MGAFKIGRVSESKKIEYVLVKLVKDGPLSPGGLAEMMHEELKMKLSTSKSAASRILSKLKEEGLVEEISSEGSKVKLYDFTPQGVQLAMEALLIDLSDVIEIIRRRSPDLGPYLRVVDVILDVIDELEGEEFEEEEIEEAEEFELIGTSLDELKRIKGKLSEDGKLVSSWKELFEKVILEEVKNLLEDYYATEFLPKLEVRYNDLDDVGKFILLNVLERIADEEKMRAEELLRDVERLVKWISINKKDLLVK